MSYTILGNILAFVGGIAFVPQIYSVVKTKKTEGLSLITYLIYILSVGFWGLYSGLIGTIPAYLLNIFIIITAVPIYYYLFKNENKFKYFWIYLLITISFVVLNTTLLITRQLEVWGPLVNSDAGVVTRPQYYILLSWFTSMTGAVLSGGSFLPQIIKSFKSKSVNVSPFFMIIISTTQFGWVIFWIFKAQIPVDVGEWLPGLLSGTFTSLLQIVLIIFKIVFSKNAKKSINK